MTFTFKIQNKFDSEAQGFKESYCTNFVKKTMNFKVIILIK